MLNSKLISMLIGLGMLSACGEQDERQRHAQNDNGSDLSMNVDGGNNGAASLSVDLPGVKGKIALPSIKLRSSEVDIDGVKLYPGSRITGVDIAGEEGQSEGSLGVRFDADATPEAVRDYFLAAFKAKGMAASAQGNRITGTDKSGKPFRIMLVKQGEVTRGVVRMGNKEG